MFGGRIPVEGRPILLFSGYRGSFPGIRRPGRLVNHSLLCCNEVKIEWTYTSLPPKCLHRADRDSSLRCRLYRCTPGTCVRYQTFILWEKCWWLLGNWVAQFLSDWAAGWTTFPGTCRDFYSPLTSAPLLGPLRWKWILYPFVMATVEYVCPFKWWRRESVAETSRWTMYATACTSTARGCLLMHPFDAPASYVMCYGVNLSAAHA
jgi:hypothetical protein